MYKTKVNLILASASPRRRELLSRVGIKFSVVPSELEERSLVSCQEQEPKAYVKNCARVKVEKVVELLGEAKDFWFLGVDTIVVSKGLILGKPKGEEEARRFLQKLSGKWHQVISGYYLYHPLTRKRVSNAVESLVLMRKLKRQEIDAYLKTQEPYDKAGGYALQGIASGFISEIKGSHTNIIGLPLAEVLRDLLKLRLIEPAKGD